MSEIDAPGTPSSGILLKRTAQGYTWSVAVQAESAEIEHLRQAAEKAGEIDDQLAQQYPAPVAR